MSSVEEPSTSIHPKTVSNISTSSLEFLRITMKEKLQSMISHCNVYLEALQNVPDFDRLNSFKKSEDYKSCMVHILTLSSILTKECGALTTLVEQSLVDLAQVRQSLEQAQTIKTFLKSSKDSLLPTQDMSSGKLTNDKPNG